MYGQLSHLMLDGQQYQADLKEHQHFLGELRQLIESKRIAGLSEIKAGGCDFAFQFCESVFKVTHRLDGAARRRKFIGIATRYSCFDTDYSEPLGTPAEWEVFLLYGREPQIRYSGTQLGATAAVEALFPYIISDLLWPETKSESPDKRDEALQRFYSDR